MVKYLFTLLLIEDDVCLFNELKERLEQWSYDVHGVSDFAQVMKDFTHVEPDLVIIDIQLPKYDGYHWCRMIRSHSNVTLFFLSSSEHSTDIVMEMQFRAEDYVEMLF